MRTILMPRERAALAECKLLLAKSENMGTRRIVSMQQLEDRGLVRRPLSRAGVIAGWTLTPRGEAVEL